MPASKHFFKIKPVCQTVQLTLPGRLEKTSELEMDYTGSSENGVFIRCESLLLKIYSENKLLVSYSIHTFFGKANFISFVHFKDITIIISLVIFCIVLFLCSQAPPRRKAAHGR